MKQIVIPKVFKKAKQQIRLIKDSNLEIHPDDLEEIKLYNEIITKVLSETRVNKEKLWYDNEKKLEHVSKLFKSRYKDRTKFSK